MYLRPNFKLDRDDIDAIQKLYGPPKVNFLIFKRYFHGLSSGLQVSGCQWAQEAGWLWPFWPCLSDWGPPGVSHWPVSVSDSPFWFSGRNFSVSGRWPASLSGNKGPAISWHVQGSVRAGHTWDPEHEDGNKAAVPAKDQQAGWPWSKHQPLPDLSPVEAIQSKCKSAGQLLGNPRIHQGQPQREPRSSWWSPAPPSALAAPCRPPCWQGRAGQDQVLQVVHPGFHPCLNCYCSLPCHPLLEIIVFWSKVKIKDWYLDRTKTFLNILWLYNLSITKFILQNRQQHIFCCRVSLAQESEGLWRFLLPDDDYW